MAKWNVTFTQYYTYNVDAETEDEAFAKAEKLFDKEVHYPVANTLYDEYDVICTDDGD